MVFKDVFLVTANFWHALGAILDVFQLEVVKLNLGKDTTIFSEVVSFQS